MQKFCKSYNLSNLRSFSGWIETHENGNQELLDDTICYLWDDFTVGTSTVPNKEIVFDAVTLEWQEFCKKSLNFHIPTFFLQHHEERNPAVYNTQAKQSMRTDFIPILPVHLHCLAIPDVDPHIFNLSWFLEVHSLLDYKVLSDAVNATLTHHDLLRLRFRCDTNTNWQTYLVNSYEQVPISCIDITNVKTDQQSAVLEIEAAKYQGSLNLFTGPLVRVVYFRLSDALPGRLLFVIHHFACDAFSWSFIKDDFLAAYQQLSESSPLCLPPTTTSIKDYAERLVAYAQSDTLLEEMSYWVTETRMKITPIPVDYPDGISTPAIRHLFTDVLSEAETRALSALAKYQISMHDILLTALFQTYTRWTGKRTMLVELLNHGRDSIFKDVNLLRTAGWLNHITPFLLDLDQVSSLQEIIFAIKEQYQNIPNKGIGYGLLRYLGSSDTKKILYSLPTPQLYLNYLGRYPNRKNTDTSLLRPAKEFVKDTESKRRIDPMRIKVFGSIVASRLFLRWEYQANLYQSTTIERLNQHFVETLQDIPHLFS